jgi:predicted peptidase
VALRRILVVLTALALIAFPIGCLRRAQFKERAIHLGDHTYKYRVWLPQHYTKLHQWPVILFLHGSGERGSDNLVQINTGLGPALERFGERYKAIVIFPQCESGREWYGEMELMAMAELDAVVSEFHGDRRRIYLTGISMGGAGVWYMSRHNRTFAAIVPIAGEVARTPDDPFPTDTPPDIARIVGASDPYATLAEKIGKTPVWAFHGEKDIVIPVSESRSMITALRNAGNPARYTEFPDVRHNVWDAAYADAEMVHWMLQQKLK